MKKRILTIFISVLLIVSLIPAQAFALTTGSEKWEEAKKTVYQAMVDGKASVDIRKYGISTNDIGDLVQDVRDQFPALFFADCSVYSYVGTTVNSIQFEYNELNNAQAKAAYEKAVKEALVSVNSKMSDLDKALALHDYLVKTIKYVEDGTDVSHSAYGALVNKSAVCDGYSKAYIELLAKCGIESSIARSDDMDHVWNQVQINGKWYNVDVTWDDPTPDRGNTVSYQYFMMSDARFQNKNHYGWTAYFNCTDTQYDNTLSWASRASQLPKESTVFSDVFTTDYYCDAILWAYGKKIASGTSKTTFSPSSSCTRAQAMCFLYRAAGSPKAENQVNPFVDVKEGDYYYNAVLWAYENKIASGTNATHFSPNVPCQGAGIICFIYRYLGNPTVEVKNGLYAGEYYQTAVSWAEQNGLFNSLTSQFVPTANASRADVVTFLYQCCK